MAAPSLWRMLATGSGRVGVYRSPPNTALRLAPRRYPYRSPVDIVAYVCDRAPAGDPEVLIWAENG